VDGAVFVQITIGNEAIGVVENQQSAGIDLGGNDAHAGGADISIDQRKIEELSGIAFAASA